MFWNRGSSQAIISVTESGLNACNCEECKDLLRWQPECGIIFTNNHISKFYSETDLVSIQAAKEYLALIWHQYQEANKKLKGQLLDEVTRNLKIHRKAAIRLLNSKKAPRSEQGKKGSKKKQHYSEESKFHLAQIWKQMGYMGSKRMKSALPLWINSYEYKGFNDGIKSEILKMSSRTIERFLIKAKADLRRKLNTGTKRGVKKLVTEVPIRDLEATPKC